MARIRRAHVVAIVLAVVINVAFALVSVRLYVFPASDAPAPTDVVFVIGPPTYSRIALAKKMADDGLTSNIVVSVPSSGKFGAATLPICVDKASYMVYCLTADPFTTQGEARELQDLATQHGWTSATVVTFTPHVERARILMERCYTGDLRIVADTTHLSPARWLWEMFYQSTAFVKVWLEPNC